MTTRKLHHRAKLPTKPLPSIAIGRFALTPLEGKIWITLLSGPSSGEGGEFDMTALEAVIAKFYGDNF